MVVSVVDRDRQAVGLAQAKPRLRVLGHNNARVIAIASGKGGVGKTNLAVNLGLALSKRGRRVLVFDADLSLANVDVLLGLQPVRTLRDLVAGRSDLSEVIVEGPHGLRIAPGGCGLAGLASMDGFHRGRLLRQLADTEGRFDFILVDAAAGVGEDVVCFLRSVSEVMVVTTPEPTAMTDAYTLVKVTCAEAPGTRFGLVVNSARDEREGQAAATRLQAVAKRFLGVQLALWAVLPHGDEVPLAVRQQVPVLIAYPDSGFAKAVEQLGRRLLGQDEMQAAPRQSLAHSLQSLYLRLTPRRSPPGH